MTPSITISILAYNEAGSIESAVRGAYGVVTRMSPRGSVFVIDDGSTDRTGEILRRLQQELTGLNVLTHPANAGFGETLRDAIFLPESDWVFVIPGDEQIRAVELETLWPATASADFILGWRRERRDAPVRRLLAYAYNLAISVLLARRVRDVDSVVLFRTPHRSGVSLKSKSGFVHAEFCLEMSRRGARIAEIPIRHQPRYAGRASGAKWSNVARMMQEYVAYAIRCVWRAPSSSGVIPESGERG